MDQAFGRAGSSFSTIIDAVAGLKVHIVGMSNLPFLLFILLVVALCLLLIFISVRLAHVKRRVDEAWNDLADVRKEIERERLWREASEKTPDPPPPTPPKPAPPPEPTIPSEEQSKAEN